MYFREHLITNQLFRKGTGFPEEYIVKKDKWEFTTDAADAFYEGLETILISQERMENRVKAFQKFYGKKGD